MPEPEAITLKVTLEPTVTDCEVGCVVMDGAVDDDVELLLSELELPPPPQPTNAAVAMNKTTPMKRFTKMDLFLFLVDT